MADYDCEWCNKEKDCKYAYDSTNCMIEYIDKNKLFVNDDKFIEFLEYIKNKNKEIENDDVDMIISAMETMMAWSE